MGPCPSPVSLSVQGHGAAQQLNKAGKATHLLAVRWGQAINVLQSVHTESKYEYIISNSGTTATVTPQATTMSFTPYIGKQQGDINLSWSSHDSMA
jgi:hypothetical protein